MEYLLFIEVVVILGLLSFWIKRQKKKSLIQKIIFYLSTFTIFVYSWWILGTLTKSEVLNGIFIYFSLIATPFLFLIFAIFVIYYGLHGIIKREIYVKMPLPTQLEGPGAVIFGFVFLITGMALLSLWGGAMKIFLCHQERSNLFCVLLDFLDRTIPFWGTLLEKITAPLYKLGIFEEN